MLLDDIKIGKCCWGVSGLTSVVGKYHDRKLLLGNIQIDRCCWEMLPGNAVVCFREILVGKDRVGNVKIENKRCPVEDV